MSCCRFSLVKLPGTLAMSSSMCCQSMSPISESFNRGAMFRLISRNTMSEKPNVLFVTTLSNCIHRLFVSSQIFIR